MPLQSQQSLILSEYLNSFISNMKLYWLDAITRQLSHPNGILPIKQNCAVVIAFINLRVDRGTRSLAKTDKKGVEGQKYLNFFPDRVLSTCTPMRNRAINQSFLKLNKSVIRCKLNIATNVRSFIEQSVNHVSNRSTSDDRKPVDTCMWCLCYWAWALKPDSNLSPTLCGSTYNSNIN